MERIAIRPATEADLSRLAKLRHSLWPEGSREEHQQDLAVILSDASRLVMPRTVIVADRGGELVGFLEAGLRSHADGCDWLRKVGYVEGWFVVAEMRGQGIGARLIHAAEEWARQEGCAEMASDTWLDREASQRAHEAVGFEEVDRVVNYRKKL